MDGIKLEQVSYSTYYLYLFFIIFHPFFLLELLFLLEDEKSSTFCSTWAQKNNCLSSPHTCSPIYIVYTCSPIYIVYTCSCRMRQPVFSLLKVLYGV